MVTVELNTTYDEFVKLTEEQKTKLLVQQAEEKLLNEKQAADAAAEVAAKRLEYETAARALEEEYRLKRVALDASFAPQPVGSDGNSLQTVVGRPEP